MIHLLMPTARFSQMPSTLRAAARWERLGPDVPAMLAHPDWESGAPAPVVIWMHGRTVNKELDPGRYLRWIRGGIGVCALDLPGHGERLDHDLQRPEQTFDVVRQMLDEIDPIVDSLRESRHFDMNRLAIGGMSAGGMVTLARLCRPHPFTCATVEATSGSWQHQHHRAMFKDQPENDVAALNPIEHLENWRNIPLMAVHHTLDEWVNFEGQQAFIDALATQYADPSIINWLILNEPTGAPYEHAGFGRKSAEVKNQQFEFLKRHLMGHPGAQ